MGTFSESLADLEQRLGGKISALVPWTQGPPLDLWKKLFPRAKNVVLCPPEPRPQLLQAACLAGALRAPGMILRKVPLYTWMAFWANVLMLVAIPPLTAALIMSLVIDHFGWLRVDTHPITLPRALGGALMVCGVVLIARF